MISKKLNVIIYAFLTFSSLIASDDMSDESLEDIMGMESELKAEVGSRSGSRSFLDSSSPVDVITFEQIEHSGLTSLTDALRYFVAGFNAPSPSVSDGSDHVRAFTLRGMSPDQILVLVNGKRVHTSALLHVNGTIGRGSSHVDLNTIAVSSIEKIEILRDGAAAQYGSDAISGVINIILKGIGHKNSVTIHGGKRKNGDGTQLNADAFITLPMKYDGFVNLTMEAKTQDQTQKAGLDRRASVGTVKTHYGLPESKSYLAVLNVELPQADNITIYSNAILNYRDSKASAFFRPYDHNAETTLIYPDGYLPIINAKVFDYSATLGANGEIVDGVYWDLSNVYGYNNVHFFVDDSMNYTLSAASPTSFDNGSLSFIQNTTNLDLKTKIEKLSLAFGLEYRYENYQIKAGDYESYYNGGSQGFAGFRPDNETDSSRNSYASYLDATYNFTDTFSLESALRYENFSDFGSTTNVKLALAYKIIPKLLLRSSASTGFRAPSLVQSNFSQTSSFVDGTSGVSTSQGTFKPDHEVSQLFGAEPLSAEKSQHFSVGSVYQPTENLSFMLDYFYTKVDDRIMLSSEFALSDSQKALYGVSKARFFTNAVDTKTQGIDAKLNYRYNLEDSSKLDFAFWYNYSKTVITAFNGSSTTRENSFDQIDRVENGQPKDSIRVLTNYQTQKLNIALNISRYGAFRQVVSDKAYDFDPMITTDLDIAYKVTKDIKLSVGGNNIFDITPNKWDGLSGIGFGYDGILPYSNYSPAGYSGAYYYFRASIEF